MKRLGVVLSGGGARGIAHAGVLKALEERGFVVDCLSGTSTGAIVGAFHAAGCGTEEILDFFNTKSPLKLSKVSVGKPGIFDTAKIREDFLEYIPTDSFESLEKKLFITATDIVNAKQVVFESGPLICAILASASIPGVFTPTEIEGRWYSDGGILDNFPVEPLKGLCDVLLGVYASPLKHVRRSDLTSSLSVVQRALDLGVYFTSKAKFHECDVVICPEGLSAHWTFDTKHSREILDLGYRTALEHMDSIEQALAAMG